MNVQKNSGLIALRVLVLCKRFYTNKDLFADRFGRLFHIPVSLSSRGLDVRVVALDYRNRKSHSADHDGVRFETLPAQGMSLFGGLIRFWRLASEFQPDVLVASGDSHIGFLGLLAAGRLDVRFVFDVYDYYPVFPGNRIPLMKTMFSQSVRRASLVLAASAKLREQLLNLNEKVVVVSNGVDHSLFTPGDKLVARSALGLDTDEVIVGYFGSITPTRGPLLIEACTLLRSRVPDVRLLLAGRNHSVELKDSWITYLGEVSQEKVPELIRACDVAAIPYDASEFNNFSGACKIAEYLACGVPVVATRVADHAEIFKTAPQSVCDLDPQDMATAIERQLGNPEIVSSSTELSWERIAGELQQSMEGLFH